jgi:hypothetical protein
MARFFSADSFWNQPLNEDVTPDTQSDRWIELLINVQNEFLGRTGMHINLYNWTMPVFEADAGTPRVKVERKIEKCRMNPGFRMAVLDHLSEAHPRGHHVSFGESVPIPSEAEPDGQEDAHVVIIDRDALAIPCEAAAFPMRSAGWRPFQSEKSSQSTCRTPPRFKVCT